MQLNPAKIPENKEVKEYLSWRATCVTEAQTKNLVNKLADAICVKSNFVTYVGMSQKPQKVEDGKAYFTPDTKVVYFTLTATEGHEYLPLFTDEAELLKWQQATEKKPFKMLMTFDDLGPVFVTNTKFSGVVINPMSDNFIMPRGLIASWMTRKRAVLDAAIREVMKKKAAAKDSAVDTQSGND